MKQIIVMAAVLILLLTFPLQYALEQRNYYNLSQFQKIVYTSKEQARVKGYFSNDIVDDLKAKIMATFKDIDESEIIIEVTQTPKYRTDDFDDRELIHYKIGVPIKRIIAANGLWGISDSDNASYYIIDDYIASELVDI